MYVQLSTSRQNVTGLTLKLSNFVKDRDKHVLGLVIFHLAELDRYEEGLFQTLKSFVIS